MRWGFALFLLFSGSVQAAEIQNTLTLYFIQSPIGLNWNSPQSLTASTLTNQFVPVPKTASRDPIGHVNVEYHCPKLNAHVFTGSTADDTSLGRERALKLGYGLGAMLATSPGHLEGEDSRSDLETYAANGRLSILKMIINDEACGRIVSYMKAYRATGQDKVYGSLQSDPLKREGAGCSAFGASFLEILGYLMPAQRDSWMRYLGVPYQYIGGPITGKKVSLPKLLVAFNSSWLPAGSNDGVWIHFYDPDLMHRWAREEYARIKLRKTDYPFPVSHFSQQKALGVVYDLRGFKPLSGSFFK